MRGISLVAFALVVTGAALAGEPKTFLGFRLLDLESQSVKWQSPRFGEPAAVTYGFARAATETPGARNCARMLPPERAHLRSGIGESAFRREVAAAFRMWEEVANIAFREAADPEATDILIGAQAETLGRAFTNVSLKPGADGGKVIGRALICLNPHQRWKVGFDGNLDVYDVRYTIAHEIGHAIGLDHPSAAGELMSYRYDERHTGLQRGDIRGATLLYGARPGAARFAETEASPSPAGTAGKRAAGSPFGIGEDGPRSGAAR